MEIGRKTTNDTAALQDAAATLRQNGGLGQQGLLVDLFDYLLKTTIEGRSPKESEIAIEVFGRDPAFNPTEDATVRVYIHRLRKKIGDAYVSGQIAGSRVVLPRGEYRLELMREEKGGAPEKPSFKRMGGLVAGVVIGAGLVLLVNLLWSSNAPDRFAEVRQSVVWKLLAGSSRPTSIVLGDYVMPPPGHDYGMLMMPVAGGAALQAILPVLGSMDSKWGDPRLISMSETTPDRIKLSNIVYLGRLDTMGDLAKPWQSVSRLRLSSGNEWYIKGVNIAMNRERTEIEVASSTHRDFAYIATFPGPNDTRVVIIGGVESAGLAQAAEIAISPKFLSELASKVGGAHDFEAVYDVRTMGTTNIGASLLYSGPINARNIWSAQDP
ncbi:helix-turn-helix domain-containing protein [Sphingobium subterraneum]|uniref:Uncharacterized protein n=1 Tax=Sphingobium subterraneum TaxID=627688 RepID=A0A841J1L2_9SPHN|nr:helix-turn-helix domain-containing protein [Sphingobium subterraneum]MBB6123426.1 hypothetical protein [Sphingobium subterraneum]